LYRRQRGSAQTRRLDGSLKLPLVGEKGMLTDGGVRVPFVAAWPGTVPAGTVYEEPVTSLDVAATALVAAGGDLEAARREPAPRSADASDHFAELRLNGVDLVPYLTGRSQAAPHERLFWRWRSQAAVLEHPWKLVRLGHDATYLFDVTTPDSELENLAVQHPDLVTRLAGALDEWSATLPPPGPETPLNPQDAQFFARHVDQVPGVEPAKRTRRPRAKQPRSPACSSRSGSIPRSAASAAPRASASFGTSATSAA
jgi:arylsulfatase A-like enzyme